MTDRLLAEYDVQTPSFKRAILQTILANSDRTLQLFQLIRDNKFPKSEIDPLTANQLRKHAHAGIKQAATELFQQPSAAERLKVVETYQTSLKTSGDPVRGRAVFEKNCTTCHKIGQLGQNVAPDISDARDKTPAALLNDILNPNQAIDNNYVSYTIVTKEGKTFTGIIASESATSVTLKQPEGKTDSILRADIEILRSNGISLMPEGLEKSLTPPQMADLIAFIKNWRYVEENIPYQR
ncbi:MAG: c-type cytochrome [Planctomycetales bacterium]